MTTELRTLVASALGDAYRLERELPGGGMSRVFVAEDTALSRKVVVKVLPPDLAGSVNVERFRREIQFAARLQHAHIVPVLSAVDTAGLLLFTMPLVRGESLRARLARVGELPIGEAVAILRDVAKALAYAHREGIVHRDIKPENILVDDATAVVTDFGVAKALSSSTNPGSSAAGTLTSLGVALGTPAYMAPEQAAADPNVDHRADIYAFGVIAYEMLAGRSPFHGRTPQQQLAAHLTDTPELIDRIRPSIPAPLAALVTRCLAKHAADRPQSAVDLLHGLDAISLTGGTAPVTTSSGGMTATDRLTLARALTIYAVALLVVTGAAWLATELIGLPDWVVPGALVVMALGLPVLVLTAFVQRPDGPLVTTPRGSVPTPARGTGTWLARIARPWFTWRSAMLGGAAAVGAFTLVVAAYMVSRTLGIGPSASLQAAGVLAKSDRIIVADFGTAASDSLLGSVVAEAMRTDLSQSRNISVMQTNDLRQVLARMQRPRDAVLDFPLAREVATREGLKAVLDGDVRQAGSSYLLSVRLISSQTGQTLLTYAETARGEDDLLPAAGRLSRKIRAKVGESLRSIRSAPPMQRVTTHSVEALRKYVQGIHALDAEFQPAKAFALLEEAIALDTTFAMAHRKLAFALWSRNVDRARMVDLLSKAYAHRDRLTDSERYLTVASYFTVGPESDPEKAIAAYESLLDLEADNDVALGNLAALYIGIERRFDRALELAERKLTVNPEAGAHTARIRALAELGRRAEVDSAISEFERVRPRHPEALNLRGGWQFIAGSYADAAESYRAARDMVPNDPFVRRNITWGLIRVAAVQGRVREAIGELAAVLPVMARATQVPQQQIRARMLAYADIWMRGEPDSAAVRLDAALAAFPMDSVPPVQRDYLELVELYAFAGRPERARNFLREAERTLGTTRYQDRRTQAIMVAHIAVAEGRPDEAIPRYRTILERDCTVCVLPFLAYAYEHAHMPDSAIATHEAYLASTSFSRVVMDVRFLAPTHRRLGELYASRGNDAKALEHFGRFVELWKDAESPLQPQVREVRRRMDEIRARIG